MAKGVLIIGESGSGKSTSIENLDPATNFIINVKGKSLPFRGWKSKYSLFGKDNPKGNYYSSDKTANIISMLGIISSTCPHIKTVVVDDSQYLAASEYMEKASEKGYEKFMSIGKNLYNLVDVQTKLRDDLIIYYLWHPEETNDIAGNRKIKAKTVGKMVDNVLTLEGMFTIVLYTDVSKEKDGVKYSFVTQTDGFNTCKSPKGMFESIKIPNDLKIVTEAIINYEN